MKRRGCVVVIIAAALIHFFCLPTRTEATTSSDTDRIFTFNIQGDTTDAHVIRCRVRDCCVHLDFFSWCTQQQTKKQVSIFSASNELVKQRYPVQLHVSGKSTATNTISIGNSVKDDEHELVFDHCIPSHFVLKPSRLYLERDESWLQGITVQIRRAEWDFLTMFEVFLLILIMLVMCTISTRSEQSETISDDMELLQDQIPQTDSEWQHFFEKIYS